mgnify:CR=1 FL=1
MGGARLHAREMSARERRADALRGRRVLEVGARAGRGGGGLGAQVL